MGNKGTNICTKKAFEIVPKLGQRENICRVYHNSKGALPFAPQSEETSLIKARPRHVLSVKLIQSHELWYQHLCKFCLKMFSFSKKTDAIKNVNFIGC